jgi:Bacterial pre-peptidase C-terminal domain
LKLWSAEGQQLAIVDDTNKQDPVLRYQIDPNKDYYLSTSGFGNANFNPMKLGSGTAGDTGWYGMKVRVVTKDNDNNYSTRINDNQLGNQLIKEIKTGETLVGNIGEDEQSVTGLNDLDLYFFQLQEQQKVQIRTSAINNNSADTFLRLFKSDGTQIAFNDNLSNFSVDSQIEYTLAPGTYYIGVNGSGLEVGNYDPFNENSVKPALTTSLGDYGLSLTIVPVVQNATPSNLMFTPDKSTYTVGETLNLTNAWSQDLNGSSDLTRVDMWIQKPNGEWIDLADATTFTPWTGGNDWGSFNYSLNLSNYAPGTYTLWARALDQSGAASSEVTRSFQVQNSAPSNLMFTLDKSTYTAGETLTLTNAWAKDLNGSSDLARVDMWVQKPNGEWINLADATTFTPWTGGNEWGSFNYSLNLSNYGTGTYTLWARAFDKTGAASSEVTRSFQVQNSAPSNLMFSPNKSTYNAGETLNLTNAWAKDLNGSSDLTRVDMWVQKPNGQWIDLNDATSFTPWTGGNDWGGFNYSLDLRNYAPGTYTLWGQALDQSGAVSNPVTQSFQVQNTNPTDLQFNLNKATYNPADTLTLTGAWVKDLNGSDDLIRVDMWIKPSGGNWIDLSDAITFTPWSGGAEWASFDYSLSLGSYTPGSYTLWGQARDQAGAVSNEITKTFDILAGTGR